LRQIHDSANFGRDGSNFEITALRIVVGLVGYRLRLSCAAYRNANCDRCAADRYSYRNRDPNSHSDLNSDTFTNHHKHSDSNGNRFVHADGN
jgi:hypothetical protein